MNKSDPTGLAGTLTYELQKALYFTGSRLPVWQTIGTFTTTVAGNSWQQVAHDAATGAAQMAYHDKAEHYGIVIHLAGSK